MLKIDYFNPVVDDWTSDCIEIENREKEICTYNLFVITKEMTGIYSIAEAVNASCKRPNQTVFCVLYDGFDEGQMRSLKATERLIKDNGAHVFDSLMDVASFLNKEGESRI